MSLKQNMGSLAVSIVATVAVLGPAHAQQWQQETQPAPPAYPANPAPAPGTYPPASTPPASTYPPATPYPPANTYPPQNSYPPPNAYPQGQQMPAPPKAHPFRDLFVGTLSAIIQAATGGAVASVTQGVTGSITTWFDRKARKGGQQFAPAYYPPATTTDPYAAASYPQQPYPQEQYPQQQSAQQYPAPQGAQPYPQQQYPQGQPPYPQDPTQYPAATDPNAAYAAQDPYASAAAQVYDPRTGQMVDAGSSPYAGAASGYDGTLYAGFAYEVHAVGPGNTSTPINAATHQFRSGDRFLVHFRPSLPGRMEVYNINPYGAQTRIDSVEVAAGQLTSLGPYEFAGTKGNESLRLVLAPCSTPQLLTTTRDIVNVSQPTSGGVALSNCGLVTRSLDKVRTRDIQRVAVDGGTSYALDPVAPAELSSGQLAAREVTIVFHHN